MTPAEYEQLVASYFAELGYRTRQTAASSDYGVDVFAENADERLAIQVKMYGQTTRRVNRQMMMELHGAKDYFDCHRAVLVTDGEFLPDALEVAQKLGIEVLAMPMDAMSHGLRTGTAEPASLDCLSQDEEAPSFDQIWRDHIMSLAGCVLQGEGTMQNQIVNVDWAGLERISSNGRRSRIDIEIFRLAINHILRNGSITRDEINQNYAKRASSGVVLVLAQVPTFELTNRPLTLRLRSNDVP